LHLDSEGDFMFSKMIVSAFLFFSVLTSQAQLMTASQILNQIHIEYGQRFSNGKYIDDLNLTAKFRSSQLNAIQILRQNKMIGQSFQIRNSAMADLIITVSVVQEQNLDFAGLLIERNQYASADSESLLRLFDFTILNAGMSLYSMNGNSVINIKAQNLTAQNGANIIVRYPTDFNKNQFDLSVLSVVRTAQGFTFRAPNQAPLQSMNLDVWYSIFSQDFGIKGVTFQ
jgi:hypothetical protein